MDSLISNLCDKRRMRNDEYTSIENKQVLEYEAFKKDLMELKDQRLQCIETIGKNLNIITGHKHTVNKVIHDSKQYTGLPISNKHHRQAQNLFADAIAFVNTQSDLYNKLNSEKSLDSSKLCSDVKLATQSSADCFKGISTSIDHVETLMKNIHILHHPDSTSDCEELQLETSIFDE